MCKEIDCRTRNRFSGILWSKGRFMYANHFCKSWGCVSCRKAILDKNFANCAKRFSECEMLWVINCPSKGTAIYNKGRKVKYARITNNGTRTYFYAGQIDGATAVSAEHALVMFKRLAMTITGKGRHISYSRGWECPEKSIAPLNKWHKTGVYVPKGDFIAGLECEGISAFSTGSIVITNRLTNPTKTLDTIYGIKNKANLPRCSSLYYSANSLPIPLEPKKSSIHNHIVQYHSGGDLETARQSIQPRITREEWHKRTPPDEQNKYFKLLEIARKNGTTPPPIPWETSLQRNNKRMITGKTGPPVFSR